MLYCQQVDLTIHQDWSKTKYIASKMFELESNINESKAYGAADLYSLGNMGIIIKHRPSKSWYRLASSVVNKTMPWHSEFLTLIKHLKPDEGTISYLSGSASQHVDFPHARTALNFVFDNTDPDAFTWVRTNEHFEVYPSAINTAWLLDTQQLHGVSNNGIRWSLCIHFETEYNVVKKWFDENPSLIFGKNKHDR